MTTPFPELEQVQRLYDQGRFMDAYRATRELWQQPELVQRLSIQALVLGGRLAGRLGGNKVRRWLFRRAIELDPENPLVVYFARSSARPRWHLLEQLVELERRPTLGIADPGLEASWLASHAQILATVRDFERAHALLERARATSCERAWVGACTAEVLLAEDRWSDALAVAERTCAEAPGMPAALAVLGRALVKEDRLAEAAQRLTTAAASRQSYEVLVMAVWYTCALAERSDGAARRLLATRALELADGLPELAPLADRETTSQIACCHVDAAMLLGDYHTVRARAEEVQSPYFRAVLRNLHLNPDGRQVLIPFRPVFQKHQTCLPAAVAAATGAFGSRLDVDALARQLTYDGTAVWRLVDWLRANGFLTRPFILTPQLARSLLEAGLPFVFLIESLTSGHATAAVGLDGATGTLILHDPGEERWVRLLLDRMHEEEAPVGPLALAVVPPERAELLELIPNEASEPYAAHLRYERALELRGIRAADEVVDGLARRYPDHPYTRRLRAIQRGLAGDNFTAIELQEALLAEFPSCLPLRRELLSSLHRTRNTARIRETLAGIVERGSHPGIRESQSWWFPPATYVAQYADFLGVTSEAFGPSERLLWKGIQYYPLAAELYHVLGDVYARQDRHADSVLPFRLAACLEEQNEHSARAACDALRLTGREEEGLALLAGRVERLGHLLKGGGPWMTWVEALEDFGRPDQAIAAMTRALAARPDDAALHANAVQLWVRMGRWDLAEAALERVERSGHSGLFFEAAVRFHLVAGRWQTALELAEQWLAEAPDNVDACRQYLYLVARRDGPAAALAQAERCVGEFRGHDELELLYREELDRHGKRTEAEALIRTRVHRNPLDAWAWRELGHLLMEGVELLPVARRPAALAEVETVLDRCCRLSPDSAATMILQARVAEQRGERERAVELLLRALDAEPELPFCYVRVWDLTAADPPEVQGQVVERLERRLLRGVGHLHCAHELLSRIAGRFGLARAEEVVEGWRRRAPEDPELVQAHVDLLLDHGQGRSDAERAVTLLEPAIARFPNHFGLRFSFAHACSVLLREEDEIAVLREVLRREPLNAVARRNLAHVVARHGDVEQALGLLEEGTRLDPLGADLWQAWSTLLWEDGRPAEALAVLERALGPLAGNLGLREQYLDRLLEAGDHDRAVAAGRAGVELDPTAAYAHLLLGETLRRSERHTDIAEVERCFRQALELDCALFAAADSLAVLLAGQKRSAEARTLLEEQVALLTDPSVAHGRLAWLTREEGQREKARDEMAAVVRRWPLYRWGWWLLMDWCEEDKAWDLVREVLAEVHPAALTDPSFAARRLVLLQLAGSPTTDLDPQWDRLVHDFPEHLEVNLRRIDLLVEREDWQHAGALLATLERSHPGSSLVLARRVEVLAGERRFPEAVEAACALWQLPGDHERWPEESAWQALAAAGLEREAAEALWQLVQAGTRVRRRAFELMVEHVEAMAPPPVRLRDIGRKAPLRRLLALLDLVADAGWDSGHSLAAVLERLNDLGHRRAALRWWRLHRDLCRAKTPVWQKVGCCLVGAWPRTARELRSWMADWRDHPGVEMWALANYSLSLRASPGLPGLREDLAELQTLSREALAHLPHDATVRYHACVLCEATLRAGEDAELQRLVDELEPILRDPDQRLWMWSRYRWAPDVILLFRDLLRSEGASETLRLSRELARHAGATVMRWVTREWWRRAAPRLTGTQRLRLRGMLLWARMVR